MKLTVRVEQRHIDVGRPVRCRLCPIALALNEQHPRREGEVWATDGQGVYLGVWDQAKWEFDYGDFLSPRFTLPAEAQKWACDFDEGRPVQPIAFELMDEVTP
jgi:hypothetical protein